MLPFLVADHLCCISENEPNYECNKPEVLRTLNCLGEDARLYIVAAIGKNPYSFLYQGNAGWVPYKEFV